MKISALMIAAAFIISGCQQKMATDGKVRVFQPGEAREKPDGTVSRDSPVDYRVAAIDMKLLKRGQERFQIYCAPCHNDTGDGQGMIVRRGYPAPPSYHIDRLRQVSDSYLFQIITNGIGTMYAYGDRVEPSDRWAIVAYIRALQKARDMKYGELSVDEKKALEAAHE